MGNNNGVTHLSVAQINGEPAVLVDTLGGATYVQRGSGTWSYQALPISNGSGHVMEYNGAAAFFDTSRLNGFSTTPSYWATQTSTGSFNMQQISTHLEVGDDAKVIDGVPTVAYFDRTDHKLHYRELHGTTWTDQILDSGDADWPEQVSLLQVNGLPAVAYEAGQPSGNAELVYQRMTPRIGDCNHDGVVDFADLLTLAEHFGDHGASWVDGDFDNDGVINRNDLLLLLQNYQGGLTPQELTQFNPDFANEVQSALAAVPEPSALTGFGILALLLMHKRPE